MNTGFIQIALASSVVAFSVGAMTVSAQTYPAKPIRLVVPFPVGTPPDVLARVAAQQLSGGLGQQVVIDNRPGAAATIGMAAAAGAPPDGYTLAWGSTGSLAIGPALFTKAGYDARSFEPISLVGTAPFFLTVHPAVPATTLAELVALARSQPGKLNYGSSGSGSPPHIMMEMFKSQAGVDITHIAYKGNHFPGLLAGEVQTNFEAPATFAPHVKAGKARLLAVTGASRHPAYPDIPTVREAGLPELEMLTWNGLVAPRGTSREIVARLNAATQNALASKGLQDAFANLSTDPAGGTPEQFGARIAAETEKWSRWVKLSGATIE
jgi:tripartite-type tricarboxylate transporter receptor subunit TctC